jgi:glycine/D-amino acid oxidase-like deaminating enzyme
VGARARVAIVGAGITGLSIAWHLAERGERSTVVYERAGVGAGASGVQPGGVRQQWGTRVSCLLARESSGFYGELGERLDPRVDPGFRACGYVFLAHSEPALEQLAANVRLQNELGIPSRLLSASEVADVVPGLDSDAVLGASFCAEDGYFDRPQSVVEAFAEGAVRSDVRIERADVVALRPGRAGWRLAFANGEEAEAERVVVAAGYDTPALVDLPIRKEARYVFYSEPVAERLLEPLVVSAELGFAAKQLGDGRLLASDLRAAGDRETEREHWRARIRAAVARLLPRLELVPLPLLVEGFYDVTPDHQPALGTVPGREGLFVAAGFSGHGFMIAPAVGRLIAGLVLGDDLDELLAELAPDRFERGMLRPEPQVV